MKIICVGRNYTEHIKELNNEQEKDPVIFMKPDSAILDKRLPFFIPDFSDEIHFEAELVIRINRVGRNIAAKFAYKYFDEITIGIDFTARDLQKKLKSKGLPWELAKGFDGSAAIGSFIKLDHKKLSDGIVFSLSKNGVDVQEGTSSDMIHSIPMVVEYVSSYFTLKKGDLIFTGTPKGVGPVEQNDILEGYIEGERLLRVKIK